MALMFQLFNNTHNGINRKDDYDLIAAADAAAEVPVKDPTPTACTNLQLANQWWWHKAMIEEYILKTCNILVKTCEFENKHDSKTNLLPTISKLGSMFHCNFAHQST